MTAKCNIAIVIKIHVNAKNIYVLTTYNMVNQVACVVIQVNQNNAFQFPPSIFMSFKSTIWVLSICFVLKARSQHMDIMLLLLLPFERRNVILPYDQTQIRHTSFQAKSCIGFCNQYNHHLSTIEKRIHFLYFMTFLNMTYFL